MRENSERAGHQPRVLLRKKPGRRPVDTIRVGVSLPHAAAAWLSDEAQRRGISMTDVVRRLIDEARHDYILKAKKG
jgi:hypothetical protein